MSSPPVSASGGGSRRPRYSRSPSDGGVPPSKRPKGSVDGGNGSDQHRVYTSICVKNINPKIDDSGVRELCDKKFTKYGTNSVKIYYKNQERVAFVNFTNSEDARKARHAKTGLVWENIQVFLEPVYYRRTVPAEQPLNPGSPDDRSPPSPKRRPRRPPSPSPPPINSRNRHRRSPSPPRPRRHYSPYIPLPPDLMDYAGTKSSRHRQGSSPPSPRNNRRRSRSRSISTSPVPYKSRVKVDDHGPGRAESNVQHEPTRTLFVGNLERDIRESKLKEVFGRYGTIEEIDLKVPQSSSKRAYAFIQYENMDMAYEARRAMDGHFIGKADCKIGYGKIVPTNCLWVGNIAIDMKRRDLEQAFTRYGQIKSFDYSNGDPTAIVTYNEIEDAIKARGKMAGVTQLVDGRKVRTESGQSDSSRRAGLRIDYLDRPTTRRFVIVRPQDNTTKRRTSRSTSASSASSTRSSKGRVRSISNDEQQDNKNVKRQSHSRTPSPSPPPPPPPPPPPSKKRRSLSPPSAGRAFHGPFGSYLSSDDTTNINNISDLMTVCEKLNSSAIKTNPKSSTVYPVQFILKSHAYDARMHFLAGSPQLANVILGQGGDQKNKKTELKVTQRLRLDQHKLDELEKKLRTSVTNVSSKANVNGQSSNTSLANQTKFAVLITSPKLLNSNEHQRKSNGKTNSPNHHSSDDEIDNPPPTKEEDDESSLSRLISYLAAKEAAGVITLPFDNDQETAVLHIFPPCQFSKKFLRVVCPSMSFSNGPRTPPSRPTTTINDEHLMVVIVHND